MKAIERAAIARVLIDLIKADKVIESREMDLYKSLKSRFSINRTDEIEAYSLSLGKAVNVLKEMDKSITDELLATFEDMTVSDGFCAREEALLMMMLHYCLQSSRLGSDVISAVIEETWFDERQVLYVESYYSKVINSSINTNFRAISGEFKLCGLDFVYLPQVIQHYIGTPRELLNEVVGMLSPSLSERAVADLLTKIRLFKTDTFCIEQLHHKLGVEEMADTPPAMLLRISQSRVDNQIFTNFLRIELKENVLSIVQDMADTFLSFNGSDRIVVSHKKDEKGSFLYNGFYRQIFELLLLQKSVTCHLLIDLIQGTISFPEIDLPLRGLHRKEKALYTLFVYEAYNEAIRDEEGKIKHTGGINFSAPASSKMMLKYNRRMELLRRKYARIYAAFGGDTQNVPDITSDQIRLPMISRIRSAINKIKEKIYDADRFTVTRDKNGIYGISANLDAFLFRDFHNPEAINIRDSSLFAELSKIR